MTPNTLKNPTRSVTFAAIADPDAILGAYTIVYAVDPVPITLEDDDLDGVIGDTSMPMTRTLSITTSSESATYNTTDPIVVTGFDGKGDEIAEEIFLTQANGNETVYGTKAFKRVTQIDIPEQLDEDGVFTVGVYDVVCQTVPHYIRFGATGNVAFVYDDGTTDTIADILAGETLAVSPYKVRGTSTVTKVTIFY